MARARGSVFYSRPFRVWRADIIFAHARALFVRGAPTPFPLMPAPAALRFARARFAFGEPISFSPMPAPVCPARDRPPGTASSREQNDPVPPLGRIFFIKRGGSFFIKCGQTLDKLCIVYIMYIYS